MFKLNSLEMHNFRSYRGTHSFAFPTEPGLYSLSGANKDNTRLGANGSGKSTFLEAIFWCMFGRTTRGLRATDIVSWGTKSATVSLTLTVGDRAATIKRTQGPNSLTLDGVPCEQDTINKYLRLTPEAFTYAVMFAQFGSSFFDLAPGPKLTLFSQILELDYWLERSNAALALSTEIHTDKEIKAREHATAVGRSGIISSDIVALRGKSIEFAAQQAAEAATRKGLVDTLVKKWDHTAAKVAKSQKILVGADARLKARQNELAAPRKQIETLDIEREGAITAQAAHKAAVKALEGQISALKGVGSQCPVCLQAVSATHLQAEGVELTKRLKAAQGKLVDSLVLLEEIRDDKVEVNKAISRIESDVATIMQNQRGFEDELRQHERLLAETKSGILHHADAAAREAQRPNPYEGQIKEKEAEAKKLQHSIKTLKLEIDQLEQDHVAVSFWINGFKKIRLMVIDKTLHQLEIEINNTLGTLGLLDWRIELDVERENKGGGVTKGFVVLIYAPGHKDPVRFEAWSGGETQRLRLAGDLGLANLIMQRAGLRNTVEFFDEPSSHLSKEGLSDLAETLNERALTEGKAIWLIDHHAINFGAFAALFVASKGRDGSRLTCM